MFLKMPEVYQSVAPNRQDIFLYKEPMPFFSGW